MEAGIASLAAATYLIRDASFGHNIPTLEESLTIGARLDAQGSAENGYARGRRIV
ncbi:MAG: oleate hydratase [Candidatus Acidiferrales bacterium]